MSCRKVRPLVALWAGGDLTVRQASRVEAHLARCEACRLLAERVRTSRAALAAIAEEAPDGATLQLVRQRVLAGLDRAPGGTVSGRAHSWFPILGWKPALVAAALAVAVTAIVVVQRAANRPGTQKVAEARPTARPSPVATSPAIPPRPETEPPAVRQRMASGVRDQHPQRRSRPASPRVREVAAEPVVIKLVTDDPDVVIYWFVDKEKG